MAGGWVADGGCWQGQQRVMGDGGSPEVVVRAAMVVVA